MSERIVNCGKHGRQSIGLVCTHVAHAKSGQKVGFFWQDEGDTGRPDAWCFACEELLVQHGDTQEWYERADFKILCTGCWDEARARASSGA